VRPRRPTKFRFRVRQTKHITTHLGWFSTSSLATAIFTPAWKTRGWVCISGRRVKRYVLGELYIIDGPFTIDAKNINLQIKKTLKNMFFTFIKNRDKNHKTIKLHYPFK